VTLEELEGAAKNDDCGDNATEVGNVQNINDFKGSHLDVAAPSQFV
jgi:hypothetical protein